jgi:hypothetical protein
MLRKIGLRAAAVVVACGLVGATPAAAGCGAASMTPVVIAVTADASAGAEAGSSLAEADAGAEADAESGSSGARAFVIGEAKAIVLGAPPFEYTLKKRVGDRPAPAPKLVTTGETPNDVKPPWLPISSPLRFGPHPARRRVLPPGLPQQWREFPLLRASDDGGAAVLLLGKDYDDVRFVAVFDASAMLVSLLDFGAYATAPAPANVRIADPRMLHESIAWAVADDGVLYVEHTNRFATGKNSYVTAVDVRTGKLRWRSEPNVASSDTFALSSAYVFTGYGLDDQSASLDVLDRATGRTLSRTPRSTLPRVVLVRHETKLLVGSADLADALDTFSASARPLRIDAVLDIMK